MPIPKKPHTTWVPELLTGNHIEMTELPQPVFDETVEQEIEEHNKTFQTDCTATSILNLSCQRQILYITQSEKIEFETKGSSFTEQETICINQAFEHAEAEMLLSYKANLQQDPNMTQLFEEAGLSVTFYNHQIHIKGCDTVEVMQKLTTHFQNFRNDPETIRKLNNTAQEKLNQLITNNMKNGNPTIRLSYQKEERPHTNIYPHFFSPQPSAALQTSATLSIQQGDPFIPNI